jgi:biopolymer transport protein ExbB
MNQRSFIRLLLPVFALLMTLTMASWAQEAEGPEAAGQESLFSLLRKGGPVMVPLALASVLAVGMAIERALSLRREKVIPPGFVAGLKQSMGETVPDVDAGLSFCEQNPSPISSIFRSGILNLSRGDEFVEKAVEDAGAREVDKMKRSLRGLSIIASISPLLGLLGTVYGMIGAFQTATSVGLGKAEMLAKGIYEALVTTATGLTIAIPALLAFQYLTTKVDATVDEIDDMGIDFIQHLMSRREKGPGA